MPASGPSQEARASSIQAALRTMAQGSHSDSGTVAVALAHLQEALGDTAFVNPREHPQLVAALLPSLRDLLHAAGWLHHCFAPASSAQLPSLLLAGAHRIWVVCMSVVNALWNVRSPRTLASFHSLLEPCRRPQVPGVLTWMDGLAAQLVLGLPEPLGLAGTQEVATHLIGFWQQALTEGMRMDMTVESSISLLLRPGLLQLVQALSMSPLPHPAAHSWLVLRPSLLACVLTVLTHWCGGALDLTWKQQLCHWSQATVGLCSPTTSRISSKGRASPQLLAAVMGREDFWWAGVAALAAGLRQPGQLRSAADEYMTATSPSLSSSSSSSRRVCDGSGGVSVAALCPAYHQELAWPAAKGVQDTIEVCKAGGWSLSVLLLGEVLGVLPWALQQLGPHARAQQANSSSSSSRPLAEVIPPVLQWPLLNAMAGSSSSSSSGGAVCSCRAPSCHLCTPPAPVTLQQLRLLLEVVCLTCREVTSAAVRAPLLLALLLQRASSDVRASFLSSADGDRLLVALQQVSTALKRPSAEDEKGMWAWTNGRGALSGLHSLTGSGSTRPWMLPDCTRAAYTLAWCFLELGTGLAAGGAAGTAAERNAGAGVRGAAAWVTSAAVVNGTGMYHKDADWTARLHTVWVPPTSLRLAAGVQPSLALFATLEALLRRGGLSSLPVLLTAALAAVESLLEPGRPGGCGCKQHEVLGDIAGAAGHGDTVALLVKTANSRPSVPTNSSTTGPTTSTSRTMSTTPSSSSSSAASKGCVTPNAGTMPSSNTRTTSSSSSSSSGPRPGPGVLAAVASVAVSVSKLLMQVETATKSGLKLAPEARRFHREMHALGLHLSTAVLHLALQQVHHHNHYHPQQQQQPRASRKELLQLSGAAQRLLYYAGAAGLADARARVTTEGRVSPGASSADQRLIPPAQDPVARAQLLAIHLQTSQLRLSALQHAASQIMHTPHQPPTEGGAGSLAEQAARAATSGAAFAAGSSHGAAAAAEPSPGPRDGAGPFQILLEWCPIHSSGPKPLRVTHRSHVELLSIAERLYHAIQQQVACAWERLPPLVGCSHAGCGRLSGPSEEGLVANHCGVVCSGCGVARYCRPECAGCDWLLVHRKVCGRLAAALGREAAGGTTSNNNTNSGGSSSSAGDGATVSIQSGPTCSPAPDAAAAKDQGPANKGRMCAWCGAARSKLLRCGRCKAAWYCGVDHQRAAWKAGHKEECGKGG